MNAEQLQQAKHDIAYAREMLDLVLDNYLMVWRDAQRYMQDDGDSVSWNGYDSLLRDRLTSWEPSKDLQGHCDRAIAAAERVFETMNSRARKSDPRWNALLDDPAYQQLRDDYLAAFRRIRQLNNQEDALRRKYNLPSLLTDDDGDESSTG